MKRSTGFVGPIGRSLLSHHHVENLKPVMDELSPMLNAYFRAVDRAAKAEKTKAQSTKLKDPRVRPNLRRLKKRPND